MYNVWIFIIAFVTISALIEGNISAVMGGGIVLAVTVAIKFFSMQAEAESQAKAAEINRVREEEARIRRLTLEKLESEKKA